MPKKRVPFAHANANIRIERYVLFASGIEYYSRRNAPTWAHLRDMRLLQLPMSVSVVALLALASVSYRRRADASAPPMLT